jgi:hypothetical protein
MIARCIDCGGEFERRQSERWKTRCVACWLAVKGVSVPATTAGGDATLGELRDRLRALIGLCHPDRHGNSATANSVTTWLLQVRDRIGGAR